MEEGCIFNSLDFLEPGDTFMCIDIGFRKFVLVN